VVRVSRSTLPSASRAFQRTVVNTACSPSSRVSLSTRFQVDTAPAIRVDHVGEVIAHGVAVGHVDRSACPDREKRREAELRHALQVALGVSTDVLVHVRVDSRGHGN
jgi:demethoxyubiquinone hydroxylase (CLK1/Coq7/Cat5 family)